MAVLSLPLTFNNSFWSQDYRRGLEVLFKKLEQGLAENSEIIAFIRARATAEAKLSSILSGAATLGTVGNGFNADDGASLLMTFRGLQSESTAQGQAHATVSKELDTLVADPFEDWARTYTERIKATKANIFDHWLRSYEQVHADVTKLKEQYQNKTRRADEAEDDAKFAPASPHTNGTTDIYTSPRLRPVEGRTAPQRTLSVSERIAKQLKEIQSKHGFSVLREAEMQDAEGKREVLPEPKIDKGKGRADPDALPALPAPSESPQPLSPLALPKTDEPEQEFEPAPILLAEIPFAPSVVTQGLVQAAAELRLRPVRFPLLGEYQDCFTGDEFAAWLCQNVPELEGNLDRAEDAARDLTEKEGLLRRIGEFGNQFEPLDDAWYQFRAKAFNLDGTNPELVGAPPSIRNTQSEPLMKRTGGLVSLVSKALATNNSEPVWSRLRKEADEADKVYRVAVRSLDRKRLGLEERIEETLKTLQRWELERLRAVKTVLLQYQGSLNNLPKSLDASIERSATLVTSFQPESDLTALIERYRTGPFKPNPQVYESSTYDENDVVFGIDLRKWAEGTSGWSAISAGVTDQGKKDTVPPVLTALFQGLDDAYEKLPNDIERRKAWIYDVPLPAVHHLREALNALPPDQPIPVDLVSQYDAPVIASAIKLWILELDPPLCLYEGWDEFRKLYPTVGSTAKAEFAEKDSKEHIQNLGSALQRLPRVHLLVLDKIVSYLKMLVEETEVEESNEVFITKLALSIGRSVLRPRVETELSIQDRHPTLLFFDLLTNYEDILPPTIARKKRESERKVPLRKRTAPVDMRLSRSRISLGADTQQLLAAQQIAQNPSLGKNMKSPELPSIPPPAVIAPEPAEMVLAPPPPPPPPSVTPVVPPPPPLDVPSFKEHPVEAEEFPNRPTFKEPPPEIPSPPPNRPSFKEPPPEEDESPISQEIPLPPPGTTVTHPTLQKRGSISLGRTSSPSYLKQNTSRSPSPPVTEDTVLSTGRTLLHRAGSGQGATGSGPRGPRVVARGPRTPGSGNVSSMVQNLNNRGNVGRSSPPPPSSGGSPLRPTHRLSGSGMGVTGTRPSSVLGRSQAFSRRTMASDAEDDVVDK